MDSNELKKWILAQNVRKRTLDGFWFCFENYKIEEPNEFKQYFGNFNKELLTLRMRKVALKIMNWDNFEKEYNENHEFVEAYLDVIYNGNCIGYYSLLFNFAGETFDDYFVLD